MLKICFLGIFMSFICIMLNSGTADAKSQNIDVVKDIDLDQFSGTWYEIARLPNKHENDLVEVTSTFTRTDGGNYEIVNRGYKGSRGGKCTTVKGNVVIPDPGKNGAMKVKIWWLSLDYKVIDLDKKNYEYALITTDTKKYLWVLSKSPIMKDEVYEKLIDSARQKGFNVDNMEMVQQVHNSAIVQR